MVYAPGTLETDQKKQNMALQQQAKAITTATNDIATNTANIAALQALKYGGQCKLTKSGSNLVLSPFNGNLIVINGTICTVPDAGVSLAPGSLSTATDYNIYAVATDGVVTSLEAATTAHATSTTSGNKGTEIKSGDDTRSLVGKARLIAGPAFADTAAQRFVRSWFNEVGIVASNYFTANQTTTSTTAVELTSSTRAEFILWGSELVVVSVNSVMTNSAASGRNWLNVGFNGSTPEPVGALNILTNANDFAGAAFTTLKSGLSEGFNDARILGFVNSGTGTYYGDADGRRTGITVVTRR